MRLELTKLDLPFDKFLDFDIELPLDSSLIEIDSGIRQNRKTYELFRLQCLLPMK